MDIRKKCEIVAKQLNEEQLSTLLDFAIFLKTREKSPATIIVSQVIGSG
jgi:hypothetical protein